jgi:hypothetical protein
VCFKLALQDGKSALSVCRKDICLNAVSTRTIQGEDSASIERHICTTSHLRELLRGSDALRAVVHVNADQSRAMEQEVVGVFVIQFGFDLPNLHTPRDETD